MLGYQPDRADTPREQTPPDQPPGSRPPGTRHSPPGADTPRADPPGRRLLLRTVRILLECILVRTMLILTAYGSHEVKKAFLIDINMILHTVFRMFMDLKLVARLNQDNTGRSNTSADY